MANGSTIQSNHVIQVKNRINVIIDYKYCRCLQDFSGAFLSCNTEYIVFASQNLNFIQN